MLQEKEVVDETVRVKRKKWLKNAGEIICIISSVLIFFILPKDRNIHLLYLIGIDIVCCVIVMFKGFGRLKKQRNENPEEFVSYVPLIGEVCLAFIYPIGIIFAIEVLDSFVTKGSDEYLTIKIVLLVAFALIGLFKSIAWFRKEKPESDARFDAGCQIFIQMLIGLSILIEIFDIV